MEHKCININFLFLLQYYLTKIITIPIYKDYYKYWWDVLYNLFAYIFGILNFIGNPVLSLQFSDNPILNIGLYSIFILSSILLISIVFFVLIERPCMDKNWPNKLKNYVRRFIKAFKLV